MRITLSVATSQDHCIDDMTPQRLCLSTPSDWAEVYRLRATSDAILVGGETLRRDNPTLGLKGLAAESGAVEPMRVVVSGEGEISADLKIFHKGSGEVVIFSNVERPNLDGVARVIVAPTIDVAFIVTQLERVGVRSLFVEGGAKILSVFLRSGLSTELRVAVNPTIEVCDESAPRFITPEWVTQRPYLTEKFEAMEVKTYSLLDGEHTHLPTAQDRELMRSAIDYSLSSPAKDSCYRVGAVVVTARGEIFKGYTLETSPTHHAEQAAIHKALASGAELQGATIYASMEPCSQRSSEPESCSALIQKYGFRRVLFALYEPSHFVECHGAENLRRAGVEVIHMDEFAQEVMEINRHILSCD